MAFSSAADTLRVAVTCRQHRRETKTTDDNKRDAAITSALEKAIGIARDAGHMGLFAWNVGCHLTPVAKVALQNDLESAGYSNFVCSQGADHQLSFCWHDGDNELGTDMEFFMGLFPFDKIPPNTTV